MRRRSTSWLLALSLACFVGCTNSSAPVVTPPGDFDPVLQVCQGDVYPFEHGQKFDVGIAFFRSQWLDGTEPYNDHPVGRMAFAQNGYPIQVGGTTINGVPLTWLPDAASSLSNMYSTGDSNAYGTSDSMTFTYRGFEGESFTSTVEIAPSFGIISSPDTISASQGCVFRYEHPRFGDSIVVSVNAYNSGLYITVPDTGAIVIAPHQLQYDSSVAQYGYRVYFHRSHWAVRTTPSGKRIGIYSDHEIYPGYSFPGKP